jgi:hypothetical protein
LNLTKKDEIVQKKKIKDQIEKRKQKFKQYVYCKIWEGEQCRVGIMC